mmetsp:Transcript_49413/g.119862  ORF Transcript_49413/g.119862 Transcript_49413/m.119862 type:complete len:540 (+) Transcript_49413:84-1703(+)
MEEELRRRANRRRTEIQHGLKRHMTDVDLNNQDTMGDGDQSPFNHGESHSFKQFYRDLFAEGGDIADALQCGTLSKFAVSCSYGDVANVKRMLEEASASSASSTDDGNPPLELIKLLETRETSMRLTPLMLIVSAGKNFAIMSGSESELSSNQIKVAKLLLSYGARPDAKDVCGKTVCHYGAGAMATDMTMKVVEMTTEAYKSSCFFGKEVELTGLQKAPHLNGKKGIAKGYQVDSGRRAVFMLHDKKTMAVKPENLRLVSSSHQRHTTGDVVAGDRPEQLSNVQCRLGNTSLQETIMSGRDDVATILIDRLGARVDVVDYDGITSAKMAMSGGAVAELVSPAAAVVKKEMLNQGKINARSERRQCANCKKPEEGRNNFSQCSKCRTVRYCSRDCQVEHWKNGGHKKECKKLAAGNLDNGIKLERPDVPGGMHMVHASRQGLNQQTPELHYGKPSGVEFDEPFYVKVQASTRPQGRILVYDETRECFFHVPPGKPGFEEMISKVHAEPAFQGRKTYMKASFDSNGDCTVYPSTAKLQRW